MSTSDPAMTDKQEAIDYCLNNFRWDRVHRVMTELDWGWASCNMRVPTVYEMMQAARARLEIAWDEQCTVESGGLRAVYVPAAKHQDTVLPAGLELLFIVESTYSY